MSVDRARTMGLTSRDIAEQLADTPDDDEGAWSDPDTRPAAWRPAGEDTKEQR